MEPRRGSDLRCPVCGEGLLQDIAYDEHPSLPGPKQASESHEVVTFSCGHEIRGQALAEAARDDPNVEGRSTEDTVAPVEPEPEGDEEP